MPLTGQFSQVQRGCDFIFLYLAPCDLHSDEREVDGVLWMGWLVMLQCSGVRADELDYEETLEGTIKAVTFRSGHMFDSNGPCGCVAAEGICGAAIVEENDYRGIAGPVIGFYQFQFWNAVFAVSDFRWNILFIIIFR